jgi:hypothetical protein
MWEISMRKLMFVVAFAFIVFAIPAAACEICKEEPYPVWYMCWSGEPAGAAWCYGGYGEYCTMGGKCTTGGLGAADGSQSFLTESAPVLSSASATDATPREGFVLDVATDAEPVSAGRT